MRRTQTHSQILNEKQKRERRKKPEVKKRHTRRDRARTNIKIVRKERGEKQKEPAHRFAPIHAIQPHNEYTYILYASRCLLISREPNIG